MLVAALVAAIVVAGVLTSPWQGDADDQTADSTVVEPTPSVTAPSTVTPSPDPTASPTADPTATADDLIATPRVDVAAGLPSDRPELTREHQGLSRRLRQVLRSRADALQGARVGIAVRDEQGRRILDHRAGAPLMPASTMKSVTAATVLATLGPDHRFTTAVAPTGEVVDGVVRGDLVLRGGGDPVLSTDEYRRWVYPARPTTSIEALADAVADAGITTVDGGLVADASGWQARVAAGWRSSYLDDHNARRITELTLDAGLEVEVEEPEGEPPQVRLEGSPDPVRRTAAVFAAMLAERGVSVRGPVTTTTLPVAARAPVASIQSPPVAHLLQFAMQRSDNHLADSLLRAAAVDATDSGSWASAHRTTSAVFERLGVATTALRVADGSGLSRLDRISAAQLADLDAAMMNSQYADVWHDSQAVAATSGTLSRRLVGTPGAGRFFGKTGTLDDVKAVVGHVLPAADGDPRRLHVAVVANGVPAGGQWAVSVLMDRLQLVLVDHLDGCMTRWADDDTPNRTCDQ